MDEVEKIVLDQNSRWFKDGTYQAVTNLELKTTKIYKKELNRIAIFLRSTGEFLTFCEPNFAEV